MKRFIFVILLIFLSLQAFAEETIGSKPIELAVTLDWISKTQMQRDENIQQIHDVLFNANTIQRYNKKGFKKEYSDYLKDKNWKTNYIEISNGKKEDEKAHYCAFKMGGSSYLLVYAIQYKNDLKHIYYYDALGKLCYIDIFSDSYPKFPYTTHQYNTSGKLEAGYFYNSDFDQYAYNANGNFKGRWYKENYYNRKAKVIMTRSSY